MSKEITTPRELFVAGNDSDGEQPPAGVLYEHVEIVLVCATEQYLVRRHVVRAHGEAVEHEVEASTAADCVTVLRALCGGELTEVARLTLFDAGHDCMTGKVYGHPAFARAFEVAGLEAPPPLARD